MNSAETIARALGGAKKSGHDWSCRCPSHEDQKSSLSITDKTGKILFRCHAGCSQESVMDRLKSLGLWGSRSLTTTNEADLPPVTINLGGDKPKPKIVATYDYLDESGTLLFQAVRYEPKDFRQRAPNGSWSIKGIRRIPYRLQKVLEAVKQGQTIYIVEGEKDVHAAESLGLVATCNPLGADNGTGNKWLPEFSEFLRGANVVVVPDQDEPGKKHADWVISTLQGKAKKISMANPRLGKDLADWIASGATLTEIIDASIPVEKQEPYRLFDPVGEIIENLKPIQWLVDGCIEDETIAQIVGKPGSGKSFVAVSLACSVATGADWHGSSVMQGPVFYIAGEGHNGLGRRFAAWSKHTGVSLKNTKLYKSRKAVQILDANAADDLIKHIHELAMQAGEPPRLVVIDTLARSFAGGDENSSEDMTNFMNRISELSERFARCNIILVHHTGHEGTRARGSSVLFAAIDAEYMVSKDDMGLITMKNTKMKDDEIREELFFKLKRVDIAEVDGEMIYSAALEIDSQSLMIEVGKDSAGAPITALMLIKEFNNADASLRTVADNLQCTKRLVDRMILKMASLGFIQKQDEMNRQSPWVPTEKALGLYSMTGANLKTESQKNADIPVWKRQHRADIDG